MYDKDPYEGIDWKTASKVKRLLEYYSIYHRENGDKEMSCAFYIAAAIMKEAICGQVGALSMRVDTLVDLLHNYGVYNLDWNWDTFLADEKEEK